MICNYNHNTIFHRITRIPIQWFIVAFLCSQIGHSTSCQFDQFFIAFWHSGPHCFDAFFALPREIITIDCCVLLVGTCQPPHLFRILLSCRFPNTPLAICIPCKVCAEVQQFLHLIKAHTLPWRCVADSVVRCRLNWLSASANEANASIACVVGSWPCGDVELSIGQKGDGSRSERDVLYRRERRESGESVYWGGRDALVVVLRSGRRQLREREKEERDR